MKITKEMYIRNQELVAKREKNEKREKIVVYMLALGIIFVSGFFGIIARIGYETIADKENTTVGYTILGVVFFVSLFSFDKVTKHKIFRRYIKHLDE